VTRINFISAIGPFDLEQRLKHGYDGGINPNRGPMALRPIVTRGETAGGDSAPTAALPFWIGVGGAATPSAKLRFGKAADAPGGRTPPHHHGEAETGAYLLSGRARIYFGESLAEYFDLEVGDFVFMPAFVPHVEANMSTTEPAWWIACRSPGNIKVNLPDVDDATLTGFRRA
jgi:uncharacterized RmlC-like cupin family protein